MNICSNEARSFGVFSVIVNCVVFVQCMCTGTCAFVPLSAYPVPTLSVHFSIFEMESIVNVFPDRIHHFTNQTKYHAPSYPRLLLTYQ